MEEMKGQNATSPRADSIRIASTPQRPDFSVALDRGGYSYGLSSYGLYNNGLYSYDL